MAENRYNVDDILREVREKRERAERTARDAQAAAAPRRQPAEARAPEQPAEPSPEELLRRVAPGPAAAEPQQELLRWEEPELPKAPVTQSERHPSPRGAVPEPEKTEEQSASAAQEIPIPKKQAGPVWESAAARKTAEALMQTLKKRQRGLAVTLILNLLILLGVL